MSRFAGPVIVSLALLAGCAQKTREERLSNPSGDLAAVSVVVREGQEEEYVRDVFLEDRDGRRTRVVHGDGKYSAQSVHWIDDTTLGLCMFGPDEWPTEATSPDGRRVKVMSSGCRKRAL